MKTLVAIGDSIVAGEGDTANRGGWVGRVRERLPYDNGTAVGWNVYNLGIGGNTIRDVEARLGEVLVREPDVLVLGCATNDVFLYPEDGRRVPKLPRHVRQVSWQRVLTKVTQACPQVLVTPGVVLERDFLNTAPGVAFDRGLVKAEFEAHIAFIEAACVAHGATFMPVPQDFADDSLRDHDIHWNDKGYDKLGAVVFGTLSDLGWVKG